MTNAPFEMIDSYRWEKRNKIITRDIHGVSGLMNFTYFSPLAAEPSTPMHFHRGILEIHCVVKGRRTTRFFLNGKTETYTYTGGEALIVYPEEYHATGDENQQDPCELVAVQLNLNEQDDFLGLNPQMGRDLCARLKALPHRLLRLSAGDLPLLRQAFSLFSTLEPENLAAGQMHLLCFLYRFLRLSSIDTPLRAPSDTRIGQVLAYISRNIAEPLSLEELAGIAGYSLSRFKTRFREETGQTPAFYITACKVEEARRMLEHTERSITDVAYDLGWSSSNYFCSVFKKMTGVSPLQYRKQGQTD